MAVFYSTECTAQKQYGTVPTMLNNACILIFVAFAIRDITVFASLRNMAYANV